MGLLNKFLHEHLSSDYDIDELAQAKYKHVKNEHEMLEEILGRLDAIELKLGEIINKQ